MAKRKMTAEEIAAHYRREDERKSVSDSDKVLHMFDSLPRDLGTVAERKVMAALCLEDAHKRNVSELCNAAGVSRMAWYRFLRRPDHGERCATAARVIKGRYAPPIMLSFVENALNGDTKAQLAYLQDVGALDKPQKSGDNNTNVTVIITPEMKEEAKKQKETNRMKWLEQRGVTVVTD